MYGIKYDAIGFDMDGTLLDTHLNYEKLAAVEVYVLTKLGVPESEINLQESDHEQLRHGAEYLAKQGKKITYEELSELANLRSSEVELESVSTAKAFPGVPEMLSEIRKKVPIGLLTRGQRDYAEAATAKCGIRDCFDVIEAYDDHPTGEQKPNPIAMKYLADRLNTECSRILYIGDSAWDWYCARDAGTDFVGIAFGENGGRKWKPCPQIKTVKSIEELKEFILERI